MIHEIQKDPPKTGIKVRTLDGSIYLSHLGDWITLDYREAEKISPEMRLLKSIGYNDGCLISINQAKNLIAALRGAISNAEESKKDLERIKKLFDEVFGTEKTD